MLVDKQQPTPISNKWQKEFHSIENNNFKSISHYYQNQDSNFKNKINKLSLSCNINIDKYQSSKNSYESTVDQLLDSLFKQLVIYIEEIDRLNVIITEKGMNVRPSTWVNTIYTIFLMLNYLEYY